MAVTASLRPTKRITFPQVNGGITKAMPGIANSYFRYPRRAPSVCGMTSVPYALGAFRRESFNDPDPGLFTAPPA